MCVDTRSADTLAFPIVQRIGNRADWITRNLVYLQYYPLLSGSACAGVQRHPTHPVHVRHSRASAIATLIPDSDPYAQRQA